MIRDVTDARRSVIDPRGTSSKRVMGLAHRLGQILTVHCTICRRGAIVAAAPKRTGARREAAEARPLMPQCPNHTPPQGGGVVALWRGARSASATPLGPGAALAVPPVARSEWSCCRSSIE